MGRPLDRLPRSAGDAAARLRQIRTEVRRLEAEYDAAVYELVVVSGYGIAALARAVGINEDTMHKRVARIRRARGPVSQQQTAA